MSKAERRQNDYKLIKYHLLKLSDQVFKVNTENSSLIKPQKIILYELAVDQLSVNTLYL